MVTAPVLFHLRVQLRQNTSPFSNCSSPSSPSCPGSRTCSSGFNTCSAPSSPGSQGSRKSCSPFNTCSSPSSRSSPGSRKRSSAFNPPRISSNPFNPGFNPRSMGSVAGRTRMKIGDAERRESSPDAPRRRSRWSRIQGPDIWSCSRRMNRLGEGIARGCAETRSYEQRLCVSASLRADQPHAPGDAPRWLTMASTALEIGLGRESRAETRRDGLQSSASLHLCGPRLSAGSGRAAEIGPVPHGGSMEWRPGTAALPGLSPCDVLGTAYRFGVHRWCAVPEECSGKRGGRSLNSGAMATFQCQALGQRL